MKTLNQYIKEKLIINKDYNDAKIVVKSFDELRKIIEQRYEEYGPGTEQDPIDFNDIDVSNIDSFSNDKGKGKGIFEGTNFKYIDISDWDVSSVTDMSYMFAFCKKFNQDLLKWDVSGVTDMEYMFIDCKSFNQNISDWDVSNVTDIRFMFFGCKSFNQDISNWNVSKVMYRMGMFDGCSIKNEYKPKFKK